jgi:erythrin-vacuolar iron transport family protein
MKRVDFGELSLMDALDLAILIEDEARERYEEFGDQMEVHHTPEAAEFFRQMAVNESKHGTELLARRRELFGGEATRMNRSMLWDVEAPDYDGARAFMSPRQAMAVALQSEIKAHDFFVAALPHVSDPAVAALFAELRDEEVYHQDLVRKQLDRLPSGPDTNPDDYSDEPVAQ